MFNLKLGINGVLQIEYIGASKYKIPYQRKRFDRTGVGLFLGMYKSSGSWGKGMLFVWLSSSWDFCPIKHPWLWCNGWSGCTGIAGKTHGAKDSTLPQTLSYVQSPLCVPMLAFLRPLKTKFPEARMNRNLSLRTVHLKKNTEFPWPFKRNVLLDLTWDEVHVGNPRWSVGEEPFSSHFITSTLEPGPKCLKTSSIL